MYVVGLMSGTSLDGIDVSLVEIKESFGKIAVKAKAFHSHDIPRDIKGKIHRAMDLERSNSALICSLNFELGDLFAEACNTLLEQVEIDKSEILCIASHGQTIYHIPETNEKYIKSTLQLGEAAVIAYKTGCPVVSNFRTMDMASGGQGAPLVPFADYHLFSAPDKCSVLLNLGGIANITILPKGGSIADVRAFDTGPANMVIDALMDHYFGMTYDSEGLSASKGQVNEDVLKELLEHPFFKEMPPKSTGREDFGKRYSDMIITKYGYLDPSDLIATVTALTAKSVLMNINLFVESDLQVDRLIVSGGGAKNKMLMTYFKKELEADVETIDKYGISSDEKEAVAFALLGYMTMMDRPSNVASATGAEKSVVLGNITKRPLRQKEV